MMMKMNKVSPRQVLIALAIATVIYLMFANNKKSMYSVEERMYAPSGYGADVGPSEPGTACEMKAGTGLASSLLPREVASQEDFGEFAPEDILAGQNFLEPRCPNRFPRNGQWCPQKREPTNPRRSTKPQGTIRVEQLYYRFRYNA